MLSLERCSIIQNIFFGLCEFNLESICGTALHAADSGEFQ